jgi:hypothetical protein
MDFTDRREIIERNVSSEGRSDIGIQEARSLNLSFGEDGLSILWKYVTSL